MVQPQTLPLGSNIYLSFLLGSCPDWATTAQTAEAAAGEMQSEEPRLDHTGMGPRVEPEGRRSNTILRDKGTAGPEGWGLARGEKVRGQMISVGG